MPFSACPSASSSRDPVTVPSPARVYVETYGCAFNQSDGEVMAGLLERAGFVISPTAEDADAVIVNSCTVKDRTYLDFRKRIGQLAGSVPPAAPPSRRPAVILAGCVPRVAGQSREFSAFSQIGPDSLADLPEVVARTLSGETVVLLGRTPDPSRLSLPVRRRNPAVEIIPISKGCLGSCTFCQTVLARGRLFSYPEEEILARIESAAAGGVRQIWLTSQDCGAYGLDRGTNLARLMRRIARLPGDFRVRVGMANPDLIKLYLADFVDALASERFFQFVHIPVQSGSDRVLADMKRLYTADDFRRIADALRARLPEITLATDIIVGFPTETDEDFAASLRLIEQTAVPVVNRSRFSPRPGTAAARLRLLPSKVVSDRSAAMYAICRQVAASDLDRYLDWTGKAVVEECPRPGIALARNFAYKPITVPGAHAPGDRLHVRITAREGFHLTGQTV